MSALTLKKSLSFLILAFVLGACSAPEGDHVLGIDKYPVPLVVLNSDSTSVDFNETVTLSWTATDAESCSAVGLGLDNISISGTEVVGPLTSDQTFSLTCSGDGGEASVSVSVTVKPPVDSSPALSLTVSAPQVNYNDSVLLSWTSWNVDDECLASGDWAGVKSSSGLEIVTALTSDSTFVLSCIGSDSTVNDTVQVAVNPANAPVLPALTLIAAPDTVSFNGETTLSWEGSNASSCIATGDWSGEKPLSGSQTIGSLTESRNFYLSCFGTGGTANYSVTVKVNPVESPTASLSASALNVAHSGETLLSWSSSNADSCAASGDWSGDKAASGSETISGLTQDSSFTLSCTGLDGTTDEQTVIVAVSTALPGMSFLASAPDVAYNGETTLSWVSSNADSCTASGDWSGDKARSGSETVSNLVADSRFSLSCTGPGGTVNYAVAIKVNPVDFPTASLTASVLDIIYNGETTLSWSSNNADSCTASGDWSGTKSATGSEIITSLIADSLFVLTCSGTSGDISDSLSISVGAPPFPVVSATNPENYSWSSLASGTAVFIDRAYTYTTIPAAYQGLQVLNTANDDKTSSGSSFISFDTDQAITVYVAHVYDGSNPPAWLSSWILNGDLLETTDRSLYIYQKNFAAGTVILGGNEGAPSMYTVFIASAASTPGLPTVSLLANPANIVVNGSTTLSWNSSNADSCKASGNWSGDKAASGSETISGLIADSSFALNCTGLNGTTADQSVTVTVAADLPTMNLSASALDVIYNGETTLSWNSSNADSCAASGDWSGDKAASGSETISGLIADSNFTLNCTGLSGTTADQSVAVTVAADLPTMNLSASALDVIYNGETTLSWSSSNADSCTASGDWSGVKASSGSETISGLIAQSSFSLDCNGAGGTAFDSIDVTVAAPSPTLTLSASLPTVSSGGSTALSWSSSNADSCIASGDWSGDKGASGSETVYALTIDSNFVLDCSGAGGSVSDSVVVTVVQSSTGTALLSWTPPTQNTDDTELTDLAGYKIYYGTESGNYSEVITVESAGVTDYLVENLPDATWYFAMTAYNSLNVESDKTAEFSKTVN